MSSPSACAASVRMTTLVVSLMLLRNVRRSNGENSLTKGGITQLSALIACGTH